MASGALRVGDPLLGVDIGTTYEGVLLADRPVGLAESATDRSTISNKVVSNAENRGVCDGLYAIYRRLHPASPEQSKLTKMQKGVEDVGA
jgi:hypothetical protein